VAEREPGRGVNPWRDAVIDAAVVGWTYRAEHETDPRAAINVLLAHAQAIALDPAVSPEARALVERAEAAERRQQTDEATLRRAGWELIDPNGYGERIWKPPINHAMGEAHRARFAAERERDEARGYLFERWAAHAQACIECSTVTPDPDYACRAWRAVADLFRATDTPAARDARAEPGAGAACTCSPMPDSADEEAMGAWLAEGLCAACDAAEPQGQEVDRGE